MQTAHSLAGQLHLRHLRLIAAIAEHGQLSIAAAALAMTQPAASRALAAAEARVGVPLFARNPKGMTLTGAGEALARRARNILDELNDAADEIDRFRRGRGGIVRIGAVTGAAVGYVVPALARLRALAPEAEVHVEVAASDELVAGLFALRHDMILSRVPLRTDPAALSLLRARGERVRIVAHRDHPAVRPGDLSLGDLGGTGWVMQGPGAPIRRAVEEAFLALDRPLPRNVTNTASLLMALALLRGSDVVTPVSHEVAALLTAGSRDLVTLDIAEAIRVAPYSLVTLRERRLSPVAARCRDILAGLVAAG